MSDSEHARSAAQEAKWISRIVLVLPLVLLAACSSEISGDYRNVGNLTVSFRVEPSHVKVGDPVRLTLRIQNNSGREETLLYRSAQRYDFFASLHGREVWRWSSGKAFTQALLNQTIPGQSGTSYTEMWRPGAAGTYTVTGVLKADRFGRELSGEVVVT